MPDQQKQQTPIEIESVSGEYANALQELGKILSGELVIHQQQQQGAAHGQDQGSESTQGQDTQDTQGVQEVQPQDQAAQDQVAQDQSAQAVTAEEGEDAILKILDDILSGKPSPPQEGRVPLEALRSPEALDKLAQSDPKAAYSAARLLLSMQKVLDQQAQQPQAPTAVQHAQPSPAPSQPAPPQEDWGDPTLKQLLDIRRMLESNIADIRKQVDELSKAQPAQQAQPARPSQEKEAGEDLSWLFGEQEKQEAEGRVAGAQQQDVQDALRRLELLQKLNVLMGLLDRTDAEIQRRQWQHGLSAAQFIQNTQRFLADVQEVARKTIDDLNKISSRINQHYGIPDKLEELITKAVRDELGSRLDVRKVIGTIAAEQDPKQREILRQGFIREVASLYAKYAEAVKSLFQSRQDVNARVPTPQVPTVAVSSKPQGAERPKADRGGEEDPLASVIPEYVKDLQSALQYLSSPQPLSRAKV